MKQIRLNFQLVLVLYWFYCGINNVEALIEDYLSFISSKNQNNNQKQQYKDQNLQQYQMKTICLFSSFKFNVKNSHENNDNRLQLKIMINNPLKSDTIISKVYNFTNTNTNTNNNNNKKSSINNIYNNCNNNNNNRHHYSYHHHHPRNNHRNKKSNIRDFLIKFSKIYTPTNTYINNNNSSNDVTTNSVNLTKNPSNIMSLLPSTTMVLKPSKSLLETNSSLSSTSSSSFLSSLSSQSKNSRETKRLNNSVEISFQSVNFTSIGPRIKNIFENNSKTKRYNNTTTSTTTNMSITNATTTNTIVLMNNEYNKMTIPSLFSYFSSSNYNNSNQKADDNYIIPIIENYNRNISSSNRRDIRDVSSNFEEDEIGWSNINEEVDMTIPLVLSHFQELGMTHFKLPDVKESISIAPLFITYSAELTLFNGAAYNIEGIHRNGNSMMTYRNRAFQFRLNLIIRKLQFEYDFIAKAMIVSVAGGVVGTLENILISADFSIDVRDPVIKLNDFHIIEFGNMIVQLNHNRIVQELSTFVLTPITNLFRDRITTTIASDIKDTIEATLIDFSNKDQLGIKKFTKQTLSGLTRTNLDSSEKSD